MHEGQRTAHADGNNIGGAFQPPGHVRGLASESSTTTPSSGASGFSTKTTFEVKLDEGWTPLDQAVCDKILQAKQIASDQVFFKRGKKNKYVIDLREMTQRNKKTGTVRAIRCQSTALRKMAEAVCDAKTLRELKTPSPSPATERKLVKHRYACLRARLRAQSYKEPSISVPVENVSEQNTPQEQYDAAVSGESVVSQESLEKCFSDTSQQPADVPLTEESDSEENWGHWRALHPAICEQPVKKISQESLAKRFNDLIAVPSDPPPASSSVAKELAPQDAPRKRLKRITLRRKGQIPQEGYITDDSDEEDYWCEWKERSDDMRATRNSKTILRHS